MSEDTQINMSKEEEPVSFPVRKRATWKFILFMVISLGYYPYIWLWKAVKDINKLLPVGIKQINYFGCIFTLVIIDVIDIYQTIVTWGSDDVFTSWDKFYFKITALLYFAISIVIVKTLEKYAQERYQVKIRHNPLGLFCFTLFYANFALNTFEKRVEKALAKRES